MEEKKTYIKAELEGGTTSLEIGGSLKDLGYLMGSAINSISKSSKLPLPVLMSYIEFAAKRHQAKSGAEEVEEEKDCENCPAQEVCDEMNAAVKRMRGRL